MRRFKRLRGQGVAARWWQKVDKRSPDECWQWLGAVNSCGYGSFMRDDGTIGGAHRIGYEINVGAVPDGKHLDHLCRNRLCVNPRHLEPVTCRENVLRSPIAKAAKWARRTHCGKGHEFTPENTLTVKGQGRARKCRECARQTAEHYNRLAAARKRAERAVAA